MLNDLAEILEIESVEGTPESGAPFGKAMRTTLDWFLSKAQSYGLKTQDLDGFCGFAEYGEGQREMQGILCHLDVVPAGAGWSVPPYRLTIEDGFMYGRGVVDNKGPAVVMLHVLKKLKEENIRLKRRVRLIAGCNEETGSKCLKHYVKHGEIPVFSITPDSDFPVINSEKGILQLKAGWSVSESFRENILSLKFGDRANVVPDLAAARIRDQSPLSARLQDAEGLNKFLLGEGFDPANITVRKLEDCFELETRGTAGHAMAPGKADNAAWKLFGILSYCAGPQMPEVEAVYRYFCSPLSNERLGIDLSDPESGELTLNVGAGEYKDGFLNLTLDIRLPLCADKEKVTAAIGEKTNAALTVLHHAPNLYLDPESKFIKTLLGIYQKATGEDLPPVKTGGGTYAREVPSAAAFGPTFPGTETNIHNADERISRTQFEKLFDIYYAAVLELDKI